MRHDHDRTLRIADHGAEQRLSYGDVLAFHQGDAYWGCAVAFRALQRAGELLSRDRLWDRETLRISSGHPGPGVRDTIECVTHSISNGRFTLSSPGSERRCTSDLKYEWEISDGRNRVSVRLRDDFVPPEFFGLLDTLETNPETVEARNRIEALKQMLIEKIWREPLEESFPGSVLETAPRN